MNIINKKNLYKEYDNSKTTVSKYWEQLKEANILTEKELISAKILTNKIYNMRKVSDIDKNFIDLFRINGEDNTCNLANELGADIGGLESKGIKVVFINIEFGINILLNNPKLEDAGYYLKIFELFNLGLENPEQYRKVLAYYDLGETLNESAKKNDIKKTNKI